MVGRQAAILFHTKNGSNNSEQLENFEMAKKNPFCKEQQNNYLQLNCLE
jgi:hypothetical protein